MVYLPAEGQSPIPEITGSTLHNHANQDQRLTTNYKPTAILLAQTVIVKRHTIEITLCYTSLQTMYKYSMLARQHRSMLDSQHGLTDHCIAVVTAEYDDVDWRRVIGYADSPAPRTVFSANTHTHTHTHTSADNRPAVFRVLWNFTNCTSEFGKICRGKTVALPISG